jgi:hypothetical protein
MARTYTIRPGFSFRLSDTDIRAGGDTIELEDDVAALHREKLDAEPAAAPAPAAPVIADYAPE